MYKKFIYKKLISGNLLDSFGHVNNAVYLEIFEEARWDFIETNGYGLSKILESKKGPVILELNLRFKKEILNRETILIESELKEIRKNKIMVIYQEMKKEDGSLAASLELVIGLMDLGKRKLIEPTNEWLKAIGKEV